MWTFWKRKDPNRRGFKRLNERDWHALLETVASGRLPPQELCRSIVQLGKPLDDQRIQEAKSVVTRYLTHENFLVRSEAMWFIRWGRLREYVPQLLERLAGDDFEDNRQTAANYLALLEWASGNRNVLRALAATVTNEAEEDHVRVAAYGAMLAVAGLQRDPLDIYDFNRGKTLADIDWDQVRTLSA